MSIAPNLYPRAQPYHAAEDLAMRATRLRRWSWLLLFVAALVLVLTAAAVVVVMNLRQTAAATPEPAQTKEATRAPPQGKATAADAADRESLLEALGGLSAAHLYQSYLNIGLLADAVEKEAYSVDDARRMLKSVVDLMDVADRQLAKVRRGGLDADDQASLDRIQAVLGLLRIQTETLQRFWTSGNKTHADQYHQARDAAWTGLSNVLGLAE